MNVDVQKMYEAKLAEMKKKVSGSFINTQLEMKRIGNQKLDAIIQDMAEITGKPVWREFNWRTGKILGIMRFIVQNPVQRDKLLEATGLTQDFIDVYFDVCGNLPYVNTTNNTVNVGKPMNVEATKEFIQVVASKWGLVVEDDDLSDITEERWNRLYAAALEKCEKSTAFNNVSGANEMTQEQYEE